MNSSISILTLFSLATGGLNLDRISPIAAATMGNCQWVGRVVRVANSQISAAQRLCAAEMLEPQTNAQITVFCYGTGDIWNVPRGRISRVGDRCTPVPQLLAEDECSDPNGCYEDDSRNPDGNEPNIILPLSGIVVLNSMPMLSWFAVDGTSHYNIRIRDIAESEPAREAVVDASAVEISPGNVIKIDFPFDAPLSRDTRYQLTVEAVMGADTATVSRRNFSILNPATAIAVEEIGAKLDDLNLPTEEKVLVDLYHLYISRNLKADAIASLEVLKENGSQNPQLYRMLGELYEDRNGLELAESHYERGVELAIAAGNDRELEMIRIRLDRVGNR